MPKPRRIDDAPYVHFVTFSCYRRRKILNLDQTRRILLGVFEESLEKFTGKCIGFVVMPDHVHALVWFPVCGTFSRFMQQWKFRSSSRIKEYLNSSSPEYLSRFSISDPIWFKRFYSFEIERPEKLEEKLNYIHLNPVRAGLVEKPVDWPWSSARWYESRADVGVPIHWID